MEIKKKLERETEREQMLYRYKIMREKKKKEEDDGTSRDDVQYYKLCISVFFDLTVFI